MFHPENFATAADGARDLSQPFDKTTGEGCGLIVEPNSPLFFFVLMPQPCVFIIIQDINVRVRRAREATAFNARFYTNVLFFL